MTATEGPNGTRTHRDGVWDPPWNEAEVVADFRANGGRPSRFPDWVPLLLLTTTGRRSGRRISTPLVYLANGEDLVVVASNWGQKKHPNWSSNLLATPHASVEIEGRPRRVVARLASMDQRAQLWPKLLAEFPPYQTYATRSGRDLRIFVLSSEGAAMA